MTPQYVAKLLERYPEGTQVRVDRRGQWLRLRLLWRDGARNVVQAVGYYRVDEVRLLGDSTELSEPEIVR